MNKKKVVLTGGRGFIGSHLIERLQLSGFEVYSLIRPTDTPTSSIEIPANLSSRAELSAAFDRIAPNYFIHLASTVIPGRIGSDFSKFFESDV